VQGNHTVTQTNVAINIRNFSFIENGNRHSATLRKTAWLNEDRSSSVVLSDSLLRETSKRANSSSVQINTIIYKRPSLFVEEFGMESSWFGEGPRRHIMRDVVSDVISVDVKNVPMSNLQSPVIIEHFFTSSSINYSKEIKISSPWSDWDSNVWDHVGRHVSVGETSSWETVVRCVYWEFDNERSNGRWSDSGCSLTDLTFNTSQVTVTCQCNHMTNFAILLVSCIWRLHF